MKRLTQAIEKARKAGLRVELRAPGGRVYRDVQLPGPKDKGAFWSRYAFLPCGGELASPSVRQCDLRGSRLLLYRTNPRTGEVEYA
jgi:hypothetical protein